MKINGMDKSDQDFLNRFYSRVADNMQVGKIVQLTQHCKDLWEDMENTTPYIESKDEVTEFKGIGYFFDKFRPISHEIGTQEEPTV